ncbi:MAG: type I DNA topoisomerase [Actinomycetia bacterium]|nr:type I DNA topoisomerase [Actinomycetes bacterium]
MGTDDGVVRLVIVESPAKAKTIQGYLGRGYLVHSSVGHIRDMPNSASEYPEKYRGSAWAKTGVDVENGFLPFYVVPTRKKSTVTELRQALAQADELLLATDEDREGEAIAWHLKEVLKPKVPTRRMVFHEITPEAIAAAAEDTRELNTDLVDAQETRRIVDRLFGYEVSPVLWRRMSQARSAGRVQSVAVRLVVDRERERIAFKSAEHWDVAGQFAPGAFAARLISVDGSRIATGRDFDDRGQLTKAGLTVLDQAAAEHLTTALQGVAFTVQSVERKPKTRRPSPPFMTSTLQQAAGGRLKWSAKRTMSVAQGLYDRGYITYMRTDSTTLSDQAINAARRQAGDLYGADHVPETPRRYDRKVKNAQEAHEAIRPAGDSFRTPGAVAGELTRDDFALYELIWKRTVASQMADAKVATTSMKLAAQTADGRAVEFAASGTVVVFPGFLAAYEDVADAKADKPAGLPALAEGQSVSAESLAAEFHATNPPSRYTEASLVKALEERGIGRPSTYAAIMDTIVAREYVFKRGSALVPSFLGMTFVRLMEDHFAALVDYSFTARMEETLDQVASGDESRLKALQDFYSGEAGAGFAGLKPLIDASDDIDARKLSTFAIEGSDAVLRVGRYGPYLEKDKDGEPERANLPEGIAPDEVTAEKVEEIYAQPRQDRELGTDPETDRVIVAKNGRFGPYVTEVLEADAPAKSKPRTGSLFKDMALDTVTLEQALKLLSLPRAIGTDPKDGEVIEALNGRYGPYIRKLKESRSLAEEAQIFTVTLDEALKLLAEPPRRRGQRAAAPLKELGNDPVSGAPVVVKDGRFGPYVTDGEYNATVPKAEDATAITLERAADLLAERRAKGPAKKAKKKKAAAKKSTAKKTAAKKKTAKKSAAKKSVGKKATADQNTAQQTPEPAPESVVPSS